jgi:hypothetical protein
MLRAKILKARWLALGLAASFVMLAWPLDAMTQGQVENQGGALIGFIYGPDMKTPVKNAAVKLRNIKTAKEYVSPLTDENGAYKLDGLEEGWYVLGVTTGMGDFNFTYEVMIKANEMAKLSLALKPGEVPDLVQAEEEEEDRGGVAFFKKPAGIAIIIVASGVAIYGTYKLLEALDIISPNKK